MDILWDILIVIGIIVILGPLILMFGYFMSDLFTPKSEKEREKRVLERQRIESEEIDKVVEERKKRMSQYGACKDYFPTLEEINDGSTYEEFSEDSYRYKESVYNASFEYYKEQHLLYVRCMHFLDEIDLDTMSKKKAFVVKLIDTRQIESVDVKNLHNGHVEEYTHIERNFAGAMGRAVAGSITGGTVGAILGAASAPQDITTFTRTIPDDLMLTINMKNSSERIILNPPAGYQNLIYRIAPVLDDILENKAPTEP